MDFFCKSQFKELFTLGELFISDFVQEQPSADNKVEMKMMFDPITKIVKLDKSADPHKMYGRYWYRSGINNSMRVALEDVVKSCLKVKTNFKDKIWLDIACNDGTLLSFVPKGFNKLGIDPCDDSFKNAALNHADDVIQDFFSKAAFEKSKFKDKKCDIITCIAMFYDLEDPITFLNDVESVLDDNGLFVMQLSYTPLMVEQLAFDNICHEHVMYYSLHSLQNVLKFANFKIVDVELNEINGGSFRVYCQKNQASSSSYGTAPYRDVAKFRVESLLNYENLIDANSEDFYLNFFQKIEELKKETVDFVQKAKAEGKTIGVYGASTKGNTLLQYFGLNDTLIEYAVERSAYKFGLKTVGTNIKIISEEDMRLNPVDYLLVLPWHFIDEFVQREHAFLSNGGHFIVPCPKFSII